ncbi:2-keto-3-deoxygluconate permease [Terrihalobacillus insolitus]|uniref:2-keto-3-deoxygluconate permease n=1 Tax=Terrihalobacillus insolitus TaxID=2950438 RepID=UPI0023422230|nr:2-keto-3-deoxygluconate permease [Terrihalobacillus insolitus]MDC3412948.1 2-keto-3-deoxygluconate permease [Terrihalobacillus insolitus]
MSKIVLNMVENTKRLFQVIPGSLMIVPLILAMIINTFLPQLFNLGNLTTALFHDGAFTLLGFLFFLVGTQLHLKHTNKSLLISVIFIVYKLAIGSGVAYLFYYLYGESGVGNISVLVLFIALTQPNLAMYVAITLQFGRINELSMLPLLFLLETPLFTMLALDMTSMIEISYSEFFAFLLPLILGVGIGSLLKEKRKEFTVLIPIVIPFFAFSVGSNFKLNAFLEAGFSGVWISVLVLFSGVIGFFLMHYISPDFASSGIALGSTGSTSLSIFPIIVALDSNYSELMPTVTAQLITATILTCAFSPIIAKNLKRFQIKKKHQKSYIDLSG